MRNIWIIILLLPVACGNPKSESATSKDSLTQEVADSTTVSITPETKETYQSDDDTTKINEADALWESDEEVAEDPLNDAMTVYSGEYILQSSADEEGSLMLTYKSGSNFSITINRRVKDVCSGIVESEFYVDEYMTGVFDYDGHPIEVSLTLSGITVKDPERKTKAGSCAYSGLYVAQGD